MAGVSILRNDGVATIEIDSPATRNALTLESAAEMMDACSDINADSEIGAAIIRGNGGTFCSGAARDVLEDIGKDPTDNDRFVSLETVYKAFVQVGQLSVPTIAAVRGAAVGAG